MDVAFLLPKLEPAEVPETGFLARLDPEKVALLGLWPLATAALVALHAKLEGFSPGLAAASAVGAVAGIFCITAGHHRLYAHRSYDPHPALHWFFVLMAPSAMQNSIIKWVNDHRRHHRHGDEPADPYPAPSVRGLFYSHMGWIMAVDKKRHRVNLVKDLLKDPALVWQARHYRALLALHVAVLPLAVGFACGAPLGGLAFLGFLKTLVIQQCVFTVNSFGHAWGRRPYDRASSARDNAFIALLSLGDGYHNFHHAFPSDYRNGYRYRSLDATKWAIWCLERAGLASNLRRTDDGKVAEAVRANG